MFRGVQADDGTWLEWEYTVLIDAPAGYDVGGVLPDLPVEDTHDLEGGDPSLFDIPGYPMLFISVIAFASIVFVIRKSKK